MTIESYKGLLSGGDCLTCFKCNEFGHIASNCPFFLSNDYHNPVEISGQQLPDLFNTGSALNILKKEEEERYKIIQLPMLRYNTNIP